MANEKKALAEGELEYPRMVYHAKKGHATVRDEAHHKAHLKAGWTDEAPAPVVVEEETEVDRLAALEARVSALEAQSKKK